MVAKEPGRLGITDHRTVHGQDVAGLDPDRRRGQHLAVKRHATGLDQPLHLPARGHTGPRQRLCDAFAGDWRLTWSPGLGSLRIVDHDLRTMRIALDAAQAAADAGEAPIGAVLVDPVSGEVIATGHNRSILDHDPTAHAEIVALRAGAAKLKNYRLTNLTLVVTLEPCAMCAGAISHARIGRLVYGASDPKGGGVAHGARVFDHPTCHWKPEVIGGVMGEEGAALLKSFFRARRRS